MTEDEKMRLLEHGEARCWLDRMDVPPGPLASRIEAAIRAEVGRATKPPTPCTHHVMGPRHLPCPECHAVKSPRGTPLYHVPARHLSEALNEGLTIAFDTYRLEFVSLKDETGRVQRVWAWVAQ